MLRPVCTINIGENTFDFVTEASFSSSWRLFTDTGEMTLPHKFTRDGKVVFVGDNNIFKKGDFVEVFAGYFPNKQKIYEGYLTKVKPSIPVELTFEDAAWLLKQTNITIAFEKVTLKELLRACLDEAISKADDTLRDKLVKVKFEAVDAVLGTFRITNVNLVQVLEELQKTYGLTSYFRGHTLYVGLAYNAGGKKHVFTFPSSGEIPRLGLIISDDLEYLKEDEKRFKIKAISMLEDNTKIEVEVGDPSGETRTITKYNLNEKDLREAATREAARLRYEGYRGTFYTFLEPFVKHGDEIELISPEQPEKNGVYYAEANDPEIGVNGSFQTIKLGAKVSV